MGLDAYVNCNCYKEGKTKPFPFPALEQYFGVEQDGIFSLYFDYDAHEVDEATRTKIYDWKSSACEHHYMWYVSERISNWGGYRYFQQALEDIGWSYFPTLFAELPEGNGGSVSSENAQKMLAELQLFRELANDRQLPFLVNSKTGDVVYGYVEAYEGVFMWAGKEHLCLGIDPNGFFIATILPADKTQNQRPMVDKSQILFRAKQLEQRLSEINEHGVPQKVEYYDADTETGFACGTAVASTQLDKNGDIQREFPQLLHVENRQVDASAYAYQLNALESVCKASIETGNPICWC